MGALTWTPCSKEDRTAKVPDQDEENTTENLWVLLQVRFKDMKRRDRYYVYMLQDKNGTYYSGYTRDLEERFHSHQAGCGAKYLKGRAPLRLVYWKEYRNFKNALTAERRLKKMTRERKKDISHIFETNLGAGAPKFRLSGELS